MQQSMILKYAPSSEPLYKPAKQLFANRELPPLLKEVAMQYADSILPPVGVVTG